MATEVGAADVEKTLEKSPASGSPKYQATIAVLALASLPWALMQGIVPTVITAVDQSLNPPTGATSWLLTGYLLIGVISTVAAGALPRVFGARRTIVYALGIAAAAAIVSACSPDFWTLIISRSLQGVSAAVVPIAYFIAKRDLGDANAPRAVALISAIFGLGGMFGVGLSGPIVGLVGFRGLFLVAAALLIAGAVSARLVLAKDTEKKGGSLRLPAVLTLATALAALLVAVDVAGRTGWRQPWVLGLIILVALSACLWFFIERQATKPLVDLTQMRKRPVWAGSLASVFLGAASYGAIVLVPFGAAAGLLGFESTPTHIGMVMLPASISVFVVSSLQTRFPARFTYRARAILGTALMATGYALLALWHSSFLHVAVAGIITNSGLALATVSIMTVIVSTVDTGSVTSVTGIATLARLMGTAIGSQIVSSVTVAVLSSSGTAESGFFVGALVAGGLVVACALTLIVGLRSKIKPNPGSSNEAAESTAEVAPPDKGASR
ncbi:MFS transporter [Rhodococcus koreensis]